jgi:hypothetical protein
MGKVYPSGKPLISKVTADFVFFGGKSPRTPIRGFAEEPHKSGIAEYTLIVCKPYLGCNYKSGSNDPR